MEEAPLASKAFESRMLFHTDAQATTREDVCARFNSGTICTSFRMPAPLISRASQVRDWLASIPHHGDAKGPSHSALDKVNTGWWSSYILSYLNRVEPIESMEQAIMPPIAGVHVIPASSPAVNVGGMPANSGSQ